MSVITTRSSILKDYVPTNRNKARQSLANRVRFDLLTDKNLRQILTNIESNVNLKSYNEYLELIKDPDISDNNFLRAIQESRDCVYLLTSKFTTFVEVLLSMQWTRKSPDIVLEYQKFLLDLLSAHSKYINYALSRLVLHWVPADDDYLLWKVGTPDGIVHTSLQRVHEVIGCILNVIPMSVGVLLDLVVRFYPYHTKAAYVLGGYLTNVFWLMEYQPKFQEDLLQIILNKLIQLDVNVPRTEIENDEYKSEEDQFDEIFSMEDMPSDDKIYEEDEMRNSKAEALDVCMEKLLKFIEIEYKKNTESNQSTSFVNMLMKQFENIILPTHNSHHVQFYIFYLCSFKINIAEAFLNLCWKKICDPNVASVIRQAAINYITSILARGRFIPIGMIKDRLQDMCDWLHQYIQRSDSAKNVYSIRAHLVFYSICQAVFYIISFRSRDLTNSPKNLLFLNSLQLSTLVSNHFNPLRVCRPEISTAFAGVTRTYQLTYCHAILERNARRKLALVYTNETALPEDCLDTYFPFDPYLLKKSGRRITPLYMQYQANEAEERETFNGSGCTDTVTGRRKRMESVNGEDFDDFIVDKKQKISELSKSFDRELQFNHL